MRVPKILYHGTSMLRWYYIQKDGMLKCNMPKSLKSEECFSFFKGYLYFVDDIELAALYGLERHLTDTVNLTDAGKKMIESNPSYRDVAVIGINTSDLDHHRLKIEMHVNPITNENTVPCYMYKGDIKIENLSLCKQKPFDTFSSNLITKLTLQVNYRFERYAAVRSWLGSRYDG
jgi:hypothetical protein